MIGGSSVEPRIRSGNDPGCRASEKQHSDPFVVVSLFSHLFVAFVIATSVNVFTIIDNTLLLEFWLDPGLIVNQSLKTLAQSNTHQYNTNQCQSPYKAYLFTFHINTKTFHYSKF